MAAEDQRANKLRFPMKYQPSCSRQLVRSVGGNQVGRSTDFLNLQPKTLLLSQSLPKVKSYYIPGGIVRRDDTEYECSEVKPKR